MIDPSFVAKLLKIHDLPTLPEVMSKVLEAVDNENSSASKLTTILECDHAISARILRLANSAFYGLRYHTDSIQRAIVVVGMEAVKALALATSVFDVFKGKRQFAIDPEDFWMHSLGTAKAAQILCEKHTHLKTCKICFTAGLLHDVGKYVLAIVLEERYAKVVKKAQESGRPLVELESQELNTTHAEVGAWVANHWGFPPVLQHVIEHHHDARLYKGADAAEVLVVSLANDIARVARFGSAGDWRDLSFDDEVFEYFGLDRAALDSLASELDDFREETCQFLELLKGGGNDGAD